jgi:hypothetical protein
VSLLTRSAPVDGSEGAEAAASPPAPDAERRLLAALLRTARESEAKDVFAFDVLIRDTRLLDEMFYRVEDRDIPSWAPNLYRSRPAGLTKQVPAQQPSRAQNRVVYLYVGFGVLGLGVLAEAMIFSLMVLFFERQYCLAHPKEATCIRNLGQALYWSMTTMTTTGFGDFYPHTPAGRFFAVLTMCMGVLVFGVIVSFVVAAMLASSERATQLDERLNSDRGPNTSDKVDLLALAEMLEQLMHEHRSRTNEQDEQADKTYADPEGNSGSES